MISKCKKIVYRLTLFRVIYKRVVTLAILTKCFVAFESAFLRKILPTFSFQERKKRVEFWRVLITRTFSSVTLERDRLSRKKIASRLVIPCLVKGLSIWRDIAMSDDRRLLCVVICYRFWYNQIVWKGIVLKGEKNFNDVFGQWMLFVFIYLWLYDYGYP